MLAKVRSSLFMPSAWRRLLSGLSEPDEIRERMSRTPKERGRERCGDVETALVMAA